jgi:putative endonuclease
MKNIAKRKKRTMRRSGIFHVYILQCQDGSYYTGATNNLERRLKQHSSGKGGAKYTAWKKAGDLVWSKEYARFRPAFSMERRIKTLNKKEKNFLVSGKNLKTVLKNAGK